MSSLNKFSHNVYSQFGEDGIVQELLQRLEKITSLNHWCCDVGAWDGIYLSNTANLIKNKGYSAVMIEGDHRRVKDMNANFLTKNIVKLGAFVQPQGLNSLDNILLKTAIPNDFDFLSIDVDGVDYWIFESLTLFRPKIVCVEFNPTIPNAVDFVQENDLKVKQGSSAKALMRLGGDKGYSVAAMTACNVIMIKDHLFKSMGLKPLELSELFPPGENAQYLFAGYDGKILSNRNSVNLNWHCDVPIHKIQPLPSYLQRYSGDYSRLQRALFKIYCNIFLRHNNPFIVLIRRLFLNNY
jgi:hypothetical protein